MLDFCNVLMDLRVDTSTTSLKNLMLANNMAAYPVQSSGANTLNYGRMNPDFIKVLSYLAISPVGIIISFKDHLVVYNWKSDKATVEDAIKGFSFGRDRCMYFQVHQPRSRKIVSLSITISH